MRWHYTYVFDYMSLGKKQSENFDTFFQMIREYGYGGWEMCGFIAAPVSGATGTVSLWLAAAFKMPELVDVKTCPRCAEQVRDEALVCRYCGHGFPEPELPEPPPPERYEEEEVHDVVVHAYGVQWGRTTSGATVFRELGDAEWKAYDPAGTSLVPPQGY